MMERGFGSPPQPRAEGTRADRPPSTGGPPSPGLRRRAASAVLLGLLVGAPGCAAAVGWSEWLDGNAYAKTFAAFELHLPLETTDPATGAARTRAALVSELWTLSGGRASDRVIERTPDGRVALVRRCPPTNTYEALTGVRHFVAVTADPRTGEKVLVEDDGEARALWRWAAHARRR